MLLRDKVIFILEVTTVSLYLRVVPYVGQTTLQLFIFSCTDCVQIDMRGISLSFGRENLSFHILCK